MRKSLKVVLIIASSLVGIGILCMCLAVAFGGTELFVKNYDKIDVKVMSATFDNVDIINVKDAANDVKILQSQNDQVKVTYGVSDEFSYYVKQIDDTLYVEYDDFRHWYDYLFMFGKFNEPDLIIEVPEKTFSELNVKCTSGDIEAKSVNSLVTNLNSTSGDIEVGGDVGDLTATATSGDVKVNAGTNAEMAVISTTSGKLELSGNVKGDVIADNTSGGIVCDDLKCENLDAKTTSGKIKGENLTLKSLRADSISGGINMKNAICTDDMTLEATSGSINLDSVDAANYDLHTTSGSIHADILTAKIYNVKSTSGSVRVPDSAIGSNGTFNAKTTSGSIKVQVED